MIPSRFRTALAGLTLLLCTFLSACEEKEEVRLSPLSRHAVILAFGDSLTRGTGARRGQDYPSRLEESIGRTVVNAGVPGEVTAQGLKRLPKMLDRYAPDLLILIHGGNDILRRKNLGATKANLAAMIAEARTRGVEVVLLGVPGIGFFPDEGAEFYEELAAEHMVAYEPKALAEILGQSALKSDLIHPNAKGYKKLADAIEALLKTRGAL